MALAAKAVVDPSQDLIARGAFVPFESSEK